MKRYVARFCLMVIMLITSVGYHEFITQTASAVNEKQERGFNIFLHDADDIPLEGAVFKLARVITEEELLCNHIEYDRLTYAGEKYTVVYVDFYISDQRENKQFEAVTDKEGKAELFGVEDGIYFLIEEKSSKSYEALKSPIRISIDEYGHLRNDAGDLDSVGEIIENSVYITNSKDLTPKTGDDGSNIVTMSGLFMIGSALALLRINNKMKRN